MGQGSTTTLFYGELGVRWQAAGVMSVAALKVALTFSGKIIHRAHYRIWQFSPRALECVSGKCTVLTCAKQRKPEHVQTEIWGVGLELDYTSLSP